MTVKRPSMPYHRRGGPVDVEAAEFEKLGPGDSPQSSLKGDSAAHDYYRNLEKFSGAAFPSRRRSEANDLRPRKK